ncbi:MAG: phage shock protein operon transcriptional activator [Bauldia sp.]|nr:phage shock protein operon transcriptional activator [Bauldia sp.]
MVPPSAPPPLGNSPAFLDALAQVSAAAPLDRPLLVIGERGSGKELIAERVHFLSRRWDQPLVKVNCAALSEELLESELFGHEAGAFTGAAGRRAGRFERADGGTLFLDEIAAASLRVQEKVLRVIEYGEYERLGGTETRSCDVRVVGATNLDLPGRVAAGRFRADLLDRLAFDVVTLPPLRARRADIPLLAGEFGKAFAREIGQVFPGFSADAEEALIGHAWPGNVRELKNTVERSVYRHFAAGRGMERVASVLLDPFESPHRPAVEAVAPAGPGIASSGGRPPAGKDFAAAVSAYEKGLVEAALSEAGGNQRRAAAALSLSYDQLRGLIRKHRIAAGRRPRPAEIRSNSPEREAR